MESPRRATHQILLHGGPAALVNEAADAIVADLRKLVQLGRITIDPGDMEWLSSELRSTALREGGRVSRGSVDWGQELERRRATAADVTRAYFRAVEDANAIPNGSLLSPTSDQVYLKISMLGMRTTREDVLAQLLRLGLPVSDVPR